MAGFIAAVPFIIGAVLALIGAVMFIFRTRLSIHTQGIITDIAKTVKKRSRTEITLEAPIVRYTLNGIEYSGVSRKFFSEGIFGFKKGKKINIRVNRKNKRSFVPEESGGNAEIFLFFGGMFMILANTIIQLRYGG